MICATLPVTFTAVTGIAEICCFHIHTMKKIFSKWNMETRDWKTVTIPGHSTLKLSWSRDLIQLFFSYFSFFFSFGYRIFKSNYWTCSCINYDLISETPPLSTHIAYFNQYIWNVKLLKNIWHIMHLINNK